MSLSQENRPDIQEIHGDSDESAYDVLQVPAQQIGAIWKHVTPFLILGMQANPDMTIRDIADGLVDESVQLWVVVPKAADNTMIAGCFLTSIERDGGEWVVSLYGLGGHSAKAWVIPCHEAMHRFARREDARRVRMCGRAAWQRILPGYDVVGERDGHLVYERAVEWN